MMTKYLISFPSSAMSALSPEELDAASRDSHEVVRAAKAAGVWVFGGGLDETLPPIRVRADGTRSPGAYTDSMKLNGGFTVLEVPTYDEAAAWASRIAAACRCDQELRAFMYDPES